MTKEELQELKPGDVVRDKDTQKEYVLTEENYNITDFHGMPILYIGDVRTNGNWAWLPYWYYELELVNSHSSQNNCTCDFWTVLYPKGCQCGGA